MTSKSVTEISAMFGANFSANAGNTAKTGMSAKFTEVLNNTTTGQKDTAFEENTGKAPVRTNPSMMKKTSIQDAKEPVKDTKTSIDEKVQEAADTVMEKVKEVLGVSEDEIKEAMETLGLVMTDLLNPENVTSLVAELTGTTDPMVLLTDAGLYAELKDILNTVSTVTDDLLSSLDMTQEEFTQVLENMVPKDENVVDDGQKPAELLQTDESIPTEKEAVKEPQVIVVKEDDKNLADKKISVPETTEEETVAADKTTVVEKKEASLKEQGFMENQGNNQSFQETFAKNNVVPENSTGATSGTPNTEQIMRQLTEQIKLTIKSDSTSMEMQLNPASLGKVGLQIEQKAGVITAHFTAQNEAVKAAIEGQVVQLRENLEQQGIKVESVEVTIASHEFERNLQQDNHGGNEKERETGSVGRRRVNLNAGDALEEEELSEEEELAREIMIDNGNSVDYIA